MRRATLAASIVAMAAMTVVDEPIPFSVTAPAAAQSPAEPSDPAEPKAAEPKDDQDPAPDDVEAMVPPAPLTPASVPTPAPTPAAVPVPPVAAPPAEFDLHSLSQGEYRPILRVQPAHRLAMMEAGHELSETDPLVTRTATSLSLLTGKYLEDAPRIVDLTIKAIAEIRTAKGAASPLEVMEVALNWKRSAGSSGMGPRRFEAFIDQYRRMRIEAGKDHSATATELQASPIPPSKPR